MPTSPPCAASPSALVERLNLLLCAGQLSANTVIPYDQLSYDEYNAIRGGANGIAIARDALTPTLLSPTTAPVDALGRARQYALHPAMTGLANLFNTGKAAVQLNVGPLIKPLTRNDYDSSNRTLYSRPPQLFSHNDQQSIWQTSSPEGSKIGWGGNIGDLIAAGAMRCGPAAPAALDLGGPVRGHAGQVVRRRRCRDAAGPARHRGNFGAAAGYANYPTDMGFMA